MGDSGIWTPQGGSADPGREEQRAPDPEPEAMTPEQLAEQIKRLKVSDVLLSTLSTVAQLAYAKLEPSSRDLEQARLAIEALRTLVPVLEGAVPEEAIRDFKQVVSNLQLAYASAASEGPPAADA
ncbi:MAG: hypothetical protein ACRDN6_07000 [Gaiellaceae bacterium]